MAREDVRAFNTAEEIRKAEEAQQRFNNLAQQAVDTAKENLENIKKQNSFEKELLGTYKEQEVLATLFTKKGKLRAGVTKKQLETGLKQVQNLKQQRQVIEDTLPGILSFSRGASEAYNSFRLLAKTPLGLLGILVTIGKVLLDVIGQVTEVRKELGVSAVTAGKVAIANKGLAIAAKGFGLELEDIKSAQNAILNDLGGSVDEALKLSLNFARTSAATGQSADNLASTLSVMESISSASRDVLLNQIRSNAAMIEAAGVAPALVMRDIAENAEFFASFAKDGGQNLIQAGIAARKLGLNMSAVSSITESLLDFESSIEKSVEATMLLGREINTDRARMLALTGDQEGLMKEVQRLVGSEAEFSRMNVLQRRALAESVGVNVEQLSRLVRNQGPQATGAAAGGAMSNAQITTVSDPTANKYLKTIATNTG